MCCGEPLAGTFSEGAVWLLGGDKLKGGGKEVMKLGACFGLRAPQPEALYHRACVGPPCCCITFPGVVSEGMVHSVLCDVKCAMEGR